jgi:flagellar biosynthetic protein FliQ
MTESDTYDILADVFLAVLIGSGPILIVALGVGLAIAVFQALTQVQEMTLTFVPKIVAIVLGLLAAMPFIYATLKGLTDQIFDLIVSGTV